MPYKDMFTNDIYQNEFDETMTRKFPNTYKVIKNIFPDAYKLPEDEIYTMSDILRNQGDTYDEAEALLRKHINQKQPQWNLDYLNPKPQTSTVTGLRTSTQAETDMNRLQNQMNAQAEIKKRLNDYNNKGFYLSDDQWKDVVKAFGSGAVSGGESFLNGYTGGIYYLFDKYLRDGKAAERREKLQQEADLAGVGFLNDGLHTLLTAMGGSKYFIKPAKAAITAWKNMPKRKPEETEDMFFSSNDDYAIRILKENNLL